MSPAYTFSAIIPAAGSSLRMGEGTLKPFIQINGKTILERSLETFLKIKEFEKIILLAHPESMALYEELLKDKDSRIKIIAGGKTRQNSVCLALEFLKTELSDTSNCLVAVHDAARCMITEKLIRTAMSESQRFGAVTLAVPVSDSLLQVEKGAIRSLRTIDRSDVYAVQTPQIFPFDMILKRHLYFKEKSINNFTDDCALLEGCHDVYIVPGEKENIKITTKVDLMYAEALLSKKI
jgi:2-C-methyl-D-erythritol 4-phosphate cytidylyltransferase